MTSQTFLHKATFKRAFFKCLPLSLIQLLVMAFIFPYSAFVQLTAEYTDMATTSGAPINIKDTCNFSLSDLTFLSNELPLLAIMAGAVLAVIMLWFIDSKRTMNVYYSLGLKRTTLFRSIYLAGALLMFLSIALPVIAAAIINLIILGANSATPVMWQNAIYVILSLSGMNLLGFSVAALCMAGTGTPLEGGFGAIALLSVPFALPYTLSLLSRRFLNGSAYGLEISNITAEKLNPEVNSTALLLVPDKFNPFNMCKASLSAHFMQSSKKDEIKAASVFSEPGAVFAVIFIAALVILFAFLAVRLFARRKAELCGTPNINKPLIITFTTIVGFYICCVLSTTLKLSALLAVVISLLVFVLFFIIVNAVSERNLKIGLKSAKLSLIPITVISAVLLIFATGGFGYSSYIPDANEVKSARVTAVCGDNITTCAESIASYSSISYTNGLSRNEIRGATQPYCTYLEGDEIKSLISLHQKLVKNKNYKESYSLQGYKNISSRDIAVSYTLKNGKTVTRYFRNIEDDKAMEEAILLQHNKFNKANIIKKIKENFYLLDHSEGNLPENIGYDSIESDNDIEYTLGLASRFKTYGESLMLNAKQNSELMNAIIKDIEEQTAEEFFFPESPALGYLYLNEIEMPKDEQSEKPEKIIKSGGIVGTNSFLTVTPDMDKTINLLTKWGYDKIFNHEFNTMQITVVNERNLAERQSYIPFAVSSPGSEFSVGSTSNVINEKLIDENKKLFTSNKAETEEILKNAHLAYPTTRNGYMILINGEKGALFSAYVPEEKAPEFVKNKLK